MSRAVYCAAIERRAADRARARALLQRAAATLGVCVGEFVREAAVERARSVVPKGTHVE